MKLEKTTIDTSQWVQEYADYLFNFALSRLNDEDLAKDLVQDTFIAGMQGLSNFKGNSAVKTWLVSILKRKIIDVWRQKETRKTDTFSSYFSKGPLGEGWLENHRPKGRISEIEEAMENAELKTAIFGCVQGLPEKYKTVFMDKMVDEKDSEEICKEHDITASNFWVIIHRAKLQMRECLEKTWFND
ncbi:RNA polymerase subunit sigma-70 [Putridiphycobacter roseus]|uniref:RNA polymerase subunit sigma-70 n=1 Tax=Putridiphycobacter roseus TaxID=2219161 RepID=A0A2W1NEX4_9FLAO|nr:sigma-70 family RNA polymerase sigma factor [Putridiphycobacter roseus]PZE18015.1 RNA polymerase subunit sigma-70 [Putridiphycobacter roseus]